MFLDRLRGSSATAGWQRYCYAAFVIAVLGVLYALPLLLSDRPYIDDLARSVQGRATYYDNGRPLAAIIFNALNFGGSIADLAPLPQLGGITFLCLACMLLARMIVASGVPQALAAIIASLFLLQPLMLQDMAYHFDALTMGMAAFLGAVAGGRRHGSRNWLLLVLSAIATLLALCLYQPAANVAAAVSVISAVLSLAQRADCKATVVELVLRLAGIALALLVYQLTIGRLLIDGNYATEHAGTVGFNISGLIVVGRNVLSALKLISTGLTPVQLSGAIMLLAIAQSGALLLALRLLGRPNVWSAASSAIVALSPGILLFLSFGTSALLDNPVLQPRVFVAYGCLWVSVGFFIHYLLSANQATSNKLWAKASHVCAVTLTLVPVAYSLSAAYAFGNAMQAQKELDQSIAAEVRRGWPWTEDPVPRLVATSGPSPTHARVQTAARAFPVVSQLVRLNFDLASFGSALLRYYDLPVRQPSKDERRQMIAESKASASYFDSQYFSLRRVGGGVVIVFR